MGKLKKGDKRAPIKALPSQEVLWRLFSYDEETGVLTWKPSSEGTRRSNAYSGKPAGSVSAKGYLVIGIRMPERQGQATYFAAHRLIWKMRTGEDPVAQIDHIDGDRLNNRWDNLRQATNGANIWNSKLRKDNTSGYKGVVLRHYGNYKKWRAQITVNKRIVRLGDYNSPEEAAKARAEATAQFHGEFARLQ